MPYRPRPVVIESLETRRCAAASLSAPPAALPSISDVTVAVSKQRILVIHGTSGNETIWLRAAPGGLTQIDVTTRQRLPEGTDLPGLTRIAGDTGADVPYTPDAGTAAGFDGNVWLAHSTYTIAAADYDNVIVDAGSGADTLRITGLGVNPWATRVERVITAQVPAPAGGTPSDPSPGKGHYGPHSHWAQSVSEERDAADAAKAPLAFFGDSHALRYPTFGRRSWRAAFPNAVSLGIGGDSTRQMIARVNNGLFEHFRPKTLVVMAGTNNYNHPDTGGTDDQISKGMFTLVRLLRRRLPETQVVVVGVLPRQEGGLNARIETLNTRLADHAAGYGYAFLNTYPTFVGSPLRTDLMYADNHMKPKGYAVLTTLLTTLLQSL